MWEAPARLGTGYRGSGYEISAAGQADIGEALRGWQGSPGHDAILTASGGWRDVEMRAIGIGVETAPGPGPYAGGTIYHVWFGDAPDRRSPLIVGTGGDDRVRATAFADRVAAARRRRPWSSAARGADRLAGGRRRRHPGRRAGTRHADRRQGRRHLRLRRRRPCRPRSHPRLRARRGPDRPRRRRRRSVPARRPAALLRREPDDRAGLRRRRPRRRRPRRRPPVLRRRRRARRRRLHPLSQTPRSPRHLGKCNTFVGPTPAAC